MNKLKTLTLLCILACTMFTFTACNDDDNATNPKIEEAVKALPSSSFGATIDNLTQELSKNSGATVTKIDETHLKEVRTLDNKKVEFIYTFDSEAFKYQFAEGKLENADAQKQFVAYLTANKYNEEKSGNKEERIFRSDVTPASVIVLNTTKNTFMFGANDESAYSWTRLNPITDKTGLFMPLFAKYAPYSLIESFEARCGHKLNAEKSKKEKGYYTFDTGIENFPMVKYWLDEKTNSKLEEAVLYIKNKEVVTPDNVTAFLKNLGFYYTTLKDQSGAMLYYNAKQKAAAFVLMVPKAGDPNFVPNIHFVFKNFDGQVPPETVNMPWPYTVFGKLTMDEAVAEYKKMDYFKETTDDGYGGALGIMVVTKSPDFPKILLMKDDNNKYGAALLIANNTMTLRSPSIQQMLSDKGYVYTNKSALPTFVNEKENVMAQFDLEGQFGVPCIAFQPSEFSSGAAKKLKSLKLLK